MQRVKKKRLRQLTAEENNKILLSVDSMVWSIIGKYKNVLHEDMKDIKQDILLHLVDKIIPRHDPEISKFSSFAYRCIVNFINRRLRRDRRRVEKECMAAHMHYSKIFERDSMEPLTQNGEYSEIINGLTREEFGEMKGKELKAIVIMVDNPFITQKTLAKKLGYKHPSAVSMMLIRMRKRLKKNKLIS